MLILKYYKSFSHLKSPVPVFKEWHLGDPLPDIADRIVEIQADGDELALLTVAMEMSHHWVNKTGLTKMGGKIVVVRDE